MAKTYGIDDALVLPGKIKGLLDGYRGRVLRGDREVVYLGRFSGNAHDVAWVEPHGAQKFDSLDDAPPLPLDQPEALYRALCWLAEGERCTHRWEERGYAVMACCDCGRSFARTGFQCRGCGGMPEEFVPCHGSVCRACAARGITPDSYPGVHSPVRPSKEIRAPAPIWWALPDTSALPVWVCRAVVHASVLRVVAGMGVVRGVFARRADSHWEPMLEGLGHGTYDRSAGPVIVANGSALLDGDTLRVQVPA